MVQVIRESIQEDPKGQLDLHMCVVENPARFVDVMAQAAPGHCFVFQWEAVPTTKAARDLAQHVVAMWRVVQSVDASGGNPAIVEHRVGFRGRSLGRRTRIWWTSHANFRLV